MNSFQAFDPNKSRMTPELTEVYNSSHVSPSQVPGYHHGQAIYQYDNGFARTPGRDRVAMQPISSENSVPLVVSDFISTVVNTIPRVSYVNSRAPHMPTYEMMPNMGYANGNYVQEMPMVVPYASSSVYPEAYHTPFVNAAGMVVNNAVPAMTYGHPQINPVNHRTPPAKSKFDEMTPAVKDVIEGVANVQISSGPKRTGTVPRVPSSIVTDRSSPAKKMPDNDKLDIMLYVNNDHLYQQYEGELHKAAENQEKDARRKLLNESDNAEVKSSSPSRNNTMKKEMTAPKKKVSNKKKQSVVTSVLNTVIDDLKPADEEEIISGNVCSKLRIQPSLLEPEVSAVAESVSDLQYLWNENWPIMKSENPFQPNAEDPSSFAASYNAQAVQMMNTIIRRMQCQPPEPIQHAEVENPLGRPLSTMDPSLAPGMLFPRPHSMKTQYLGQPRPFSQEYTTFKLCEFYRTSPIDSLKQHLGNRWKLNQRCNCCGESPIHFSIRLNSVELFNVLASGATIDLINKRGETALHLACEYNNEDMVTRLLDHQANPHRKNGKGETCMFICMRKGHLRLAQVILTKTNADLKQENPEDNLMIAARNGSKDFVQLFLHFKADIDYTDHTGNTAISLAVELGHVDVLASLIKNGADINRTYTKMNDASLLHLACQRNQAACVEKLLYAGASVHAINGNLERPLHIAAKFSSPRIAHMLLTFYADIEAENSWMRTPLYLAIQHNRPMMVKYLLSHGASTKTVVAPLINTLKNNGYHMIKLLVNHGLNLKQADQLGQTLFDAAIKHGNIDLLNLVCDKDTSCRDL